MKNEMWGQIDVVASWTHLSINLSCVILDEVNKALNYASTCRRKCHYVGISVFFLNLICDLHKEEFSSEEFRSLRFSLNSDGVNVSNMLKIDLNRLLMIIEGVNCGSVWRAKCPHPRSHDVTQPDNDKPNYIPNYYPYDYSPSSSWLKESLKPKVVSIKFEPASKVKRRVHFMKRSLKNNSDGTIEIMTKSPKTVTFIEWSKYGKYEM